MKVAAVGFCCMDVYKELDRCYPTGNGVDFAMNLSKLGIQASIVSFVGDDANGATVSRVLQQAGLDVSHLRRVKGRTASVQMRLEGRDRVHGETDEGVMANFHLTEDDIRFIQQHDVIHTDLFGRVYGLLPELKMGGTIVVFDFSVFIEDKDTGRILPHVDYAFCSYSHRDPYIEDFLKTAQSLGPRAAIAMLGENGSLCYDGKSFLEEGIVKTRVENTVGAGDAYVAGFMGGVIGGKDLQECMRAGSAMASAVISKFEPY
jgi:fructoselysine 6-kinase